LETGNELLGDWWNLTIPNARWLGQAGYLLRDGDDGNRFGDAIAFVNIGGLAHILWASNNSDDPDPSIPSDFFTTAEGADNGGLPVASFFDVFVNLDGSYDNSTFDNSNHPIPQMTECTDPVCTTNLPEQLPSIPEPSSLALLATGIAGFRFGRVRKTAKAAISLRHD
jgi:hypothetical protein